MTSKNQQTFGIHPLKHKKVLSIFRIWKERDENFSDKICTAIERLYIDEERGTKIEQYVEPFQLLKLPYIHQELMEEDIEAISNSMSHADFVQLRVVMEKNLNKMFMAQRNPATIFKKQ